MKRILKLCSTVAMMMLSAMVLCVGVYAATNHTYTISNVVNFSIGSNIAVSCTQAGCYVPSPSISAYDFFNTTRTPISAVDGSWTADSEDQEQSKTWLPADNIQLSLDDNTTSVFYWFYFQRNNFTDGVDFTLNVKLGNSLVGSNLVCESFWCADDSLSMILNDMNTDWEPSNLSTTDTLLWDTSVSSPACDVLIEFRVADKSLPFTNFQSNLIFTFEAITD